MMYWSSISFALLILLSAGFFILGIYRFWSDYWGKNAAIIKSRLRVITGDLHVDSQSLLKTRQLSHVNWINNILRRIPRIEGLDIFLTQAGMTFNVSAFITRCILLIVTTFVLSLSIGASSRIQFIYCIIPLLIWITYLQHKRRQRVLQIEAQLPDTLDLMARAMQAGHAFSSALLIVGSEGAPPIQIEFQTTFDEINFGISTETALHHLTQRVASRDLRFFVVATLIQLETGGNLTEILKSLAGLIRDRQRIAGSVRVLSAEGRLSAWILGGLPFVIAATLSIISPDFISKLWTEEIGILMLEISLSLMAVGIWWMWNMVRVRI